AWVLYKLDRGIDHVLVDEAQDTNPQQWEILNLVTAEFTAGAGARAARRTRFAVGDPKQSIYSFQGADPRRFEETRRAWIDAAQR
ncbi:UvrD-helicase domain-containing protein, partial [Stenotrophomonas maltophilia]